MAKIYTATVALKDGMAFDGTTTTGHTVPLDAADAVGGRNLGPRPMETLLVGLGGCTGMDVISILRKMRQEVSQYEVRVEGVQAEEHPKVYTEITVEHVVKGKRLVEESVRKAVDLSANRYCPASAMLSKATTVTHRYRMIDEETGAETTGTLK